jgi:hypothetical protein
MGLFVRFYDSLRAGNLSGLIKDTNKLNIIQGSPRYFSDIGQREN